MRRLSGRYRSSVIIGLQGIRARKLRTLLSMISLFLGVLAVVVVQAGAEVAHRALLANVELTQGKDGTRMLYIPPGPNATHVTIDTVTGHTDAVAYVSGHATIGEPNVTAVNPGGAPFDNPGSGPFGGGGGPGGPYLSCDPSGACSLKQPDGGGQDRPPSGQAIELGLTAMTGDIRQFRPYRLLSGQWLDFGSPPSLAPRIVLNKEAAKGFARYRIPAETRLHGGTAHPTPRTIC